MSTGTTAETEVGRLHRTHVRRRIHWTFWVPTFAVCLPILFLLITLGSEIALIAGWLSSGEVTFGHPDYDELHSQLDGRVIGVGVLTATLGLYLLIWIRWYRRVLRMARDLGAVEAA